MSELQVGQINSTDGSTAITTSSGNTTVANNLTVTGGFVPSTQIGGRRNLIINGAMQVAQRGTSNTGVTATGYYGPDRWQHVIGGGTYSISQLSDAPNGYPNSLKVDCTTTASLNPGSIYSVSQKIEGLNLQSIAKGTSDAQQLSWSFWVKSNMTGTYQTNIREKDNNRLVGATYTINSANTWEYKTIVFPADTTGVINNDNGESMQIEFFLRAGTTYNSGSVPTTWATADNTNRGAGLTVDIADSTDNYWQITGVQLEVGTVATPHEHISYGEQLALCQRYYELIGGGNSSSGDGSGVPFLCPRIEASTRRIIFQLVYRTEKRAQPSITIYSNNNTADALSDYSSTVDNGVTFYQDIGTNVVCRLIQLDSTIGNPVQGWLESDAEL